MPVRTQLSEPTSDFHVLVLNLPEDCDEEDVRDLFDQFGDITNIHMPKNPETDAHCGEAVITFSLRMHADRAVDQLNGTSYRDCVLDVSHCFIAESEEEDEGLTPEEVAARERLRTVSLEVRPRVDGVVAEERLAAAASEDAWAVEVVNDAMRARFDRAAATAWTRAEESALSPRLKKILHEIDSVLAEAVDAGNAHEGVYLQVANLLKKAFEVSIEPSMPGLHQYGQGFRAFLAAQRSGALDGPSNTA